MALESGLSKGALQYWGTILGAVRARLSTAELWQAIDYYEVTNNIEDRPINLQDVNRLRAMAATVRNSSERLGRSGGQSLDPRMWARAPWHRPLSQMGTVPVYQVQFTHETRNTKTGETNSAFRTIMFRGALPGSVDELYAAVELDAQQLADQYEEEHVGISDLTIFAV